jgi:hypothetical protein
MRWCSVVWKIPGPSFEKLRPNMMNSSDESLNHLFIIFTVYSLFFWHKFMMNVYFLHKENLVNIVFTHNFCILSFWAVLSIFYVISGILVQNNHSSYALFNISDVLVAFSSVLQKTCLLLFVPFWNLRQDQKTKLSSESASELYLVALVV